MGEYNSNVVVIVNSQLLPTIFMTFNDLTKTVVLLLRGEWRRVYNEVHVRIYRWIYEVIFFFVLSASEDVASARGLEASRAAIRSPESPDWCRAQGHGAE
jgi:hypothetical protein